MGAGGLLVGAAVGLSTFFFTVVRASNALLINLIFSVHSFFMFSLFLSGCHFFDNLTCFRDPKSKRPEGRKFEGTQTYTTFCSTDFPINTAQIHGLSGLLLSKCGLGPVSWTNPRRSNGSLVWRPLQAEQLQRGSPVHHHHKTDADEASREH